MGQTRPESSRIKHDQDIIKKLALKKANGEL